MKTTYRFHPGVYELGENERFYGEMEARGWRLTKRGLYLSRFTRTQPSQARYRVEVSWPGFMEEGLTEGQLAVFADCGWEHIANQGFLHVFRAPAGSDVPEFYTDPRQQAATLKKVRRDLLFAWVVLAVLLLAWWGLDALLDTDRWWAQMVRHSIEMPGYAGVLLLWALLVLYRLAEGTWRINRTYFRMKRGQSLDHAPKRRLLSARVVYPALLGLLVLCLGSMGVQMALADSRDLPETADGPYLLFVDLGIDEQRGELWYGDRTSTVTYAPGLAAEHWDVFEVVGEDGLVWMYQDVYRLRLEALAMPLAQALLADSVFARSPEEYDSVEVPGLDAAWVCGKLEAVAVKGGLTAHLEFMGSGEEDLDPLEVLAALAENWAG